MKGRDRCDGLGDEWDENDGSAMRMREADRMDTGKADPGDLNPDSTKEGADEDRESTSNR